MNFYRGAILSALGLGLLLFLLIASPMLAILLRMCARRKPAVGLTTVTAMPSSVPVLLIAGHLVLITFTTCTHLSMPADKRMDHTYDSWITPALTRVHGPNGRFPGCGESRSLRRFRWSNVHRVERSRAVRRTRATCARASRPWRPHSRTGRRARGRDCPAPCAHFRSATPSMPFNAARRGQ